MAQIWETIELAPIILLKSGEPVLGDRAVEVLKKRLRAQEPMLDIVFLTEQSYVQNQLFTLASPSLFAEPKAIIVANLEQGSDALFADILAYAQVPQPDITLILRHNGGPKAKKLLNTLKVPTINIEPIKYTSDKMKVIQGDVRERERTIAPEAAQALIDAVGSDNREMLAVLSQLLDDISGPITTEHIHDYFAGRIEVTGFGVADAVLVKNTPQAVQLARHALATGVSPVVVISALATKFRQMLYVLGKGESNLDVKIAMAPWQMDAARKSLYGWKPSALKQVMQIIADADFAVKGGSRDAEYAVEKAILAIGRLS